MAISDAQYQAWLQQDSVTRVLLVEAVYYSAGSEHTVYLSNGGFISSPTDSPANMPYDDVILSIPQFKSELSDGFQGFTIPSWGDIEITNELFDKDDWLTYAWDGRTVTLLYGDSSWNRSDFRTILVGTIAAISASSSASIVLSIRDKQWMLNVAAQTKLIGEPVLTTGTTYKVSDSAVVSIDKVWDNGVLLTPTTQYTANPGDGTFTLVSTAIGRVTAEYTGGSNVEGQPVPLCYGQCFNVSPVLINQSLLKYQVHDGPIDAITQVRDNGVPLTVTTDYTVDLSTGVITLVGSAFGAITVDVKGAKPSTYLTKTGDIINHLITTHSSLSSGDIEATSLSAFNAVCGQTVGIYVADRRNLLDVLDELIRSVGGWYTFNRLGKLIFGRVSAPSGTPALSIISDDIIWGQLKLQSVQLPQATAKLGYERNNTIQTTVAGSVVQTTYVQPCSYVLRNNQSIKTTHRLATEPDAKITNIVLRDDALVEVDRLLTLHGISRIMYQCECILTPLSLNLGDIVNLTHPRYNLESGVLLVVVGISESVTTRKITLTLWG